MTIHLFCNRVYFSSLFLVVLCSFFLSCLLFRSSTTDTVVTIDVHKTKELVAHSGHRYLDVRTTEEFSKGHIDVENPLNIPYMFNTPQGRVKNPEFLEQVASACNKDDHLIVEFKHVNNMGGGYAAWMQDGLAVKKPDQA
ncbi:protein HIGH ARSENIC CONTENT 1, mitochondrial-like isoform X2 [Papaver somniferum]|uniref:protein HIGH ARSENIC CONTENT 1, mitochondrial-like isoform X2 n=1 Tax=Papaver somniferum TaxID=3469 RepID=UPI000E6FAE1C|nr:protein HIGH ARSENIC CONTENT 1, mitochondrial-like isoform X2 [Papaver somniferum]